MSSIEQRRSERSARLPKWSTTNLKLLRKNKWAVTGLLVLLVMVVIPVASASLIYTVQPGDTLFKIAQRYNTTVEYLATINGIAN
ncbi:MAG: LysM domain-containing protein, partial [Chloroflexota bacterium]